MMPFSVSDLLSVIGAVRDEARRLKVNKLKGDALNLRLALKSIYFSEDALDALKSLGSPQTSCSERQYLIGKIAIRQRDSRDSVRIAQEILTDAKRYDTSIRQILLLEGVQSMKLDIRRELQNALFNGLRPKYDGKFKELVQAVEELNKLITELDEMLNGEIMR